MARFLETPYYSLSTQPVTPISHYSAPTSATAVSNEAGYCSDGASAVSGASGGMGGGFVGQQYPQQPQLAAGYQQPFAPVQMHPVEAPLTPQQREAVAKIKGIREEAKIAFFGNGAQEGGEVQKKRCEPAKKLLLSALDDAKKAELPHELSEQLEYALEELSSGRFHHVE